MVMTANEFGGFLATTITPMVVGLWLANKAWKNRQKKKEDSNSTKLEEGGKE